MFEMNINIKAVNGPPTEAEMAHFIQEGFLYQYQRALNEGLPITGGYRNVTDQIRAKWEQES